MIGQWHAKFRGKVKNVRCLCAVEEKKKVHRVVCEGSKGKK